MAVYVNWIWSCPFPIICSHEVSSPILHGQAAQLAINLIMCDLCFLESLELRQVPSCKPTVSEHLSCLRTTHLPTSHLIAVWSLGNGEVFGWLSGCKGRALDTKSLYV